MSRLDRQLQFKLLELMRDCYPSPLHRVPQDIRKLDEDFFFNILYLEEHHLCVTEIQQSLDGHFSWGGAKITAKGIDFLEDDGGLSAILGVVTVRLEADTVKRLIEAKIDEAELPADEKIKWKSFVSGLSETSLQAATSDLVQSGLHHIPNIIEMLRGLL
jgi:hypothetical protein